MEFRRVLFRSSLAPAIGTRPAATAAAEPPLEPPGVCAGFQGLRHGPQASGSVMPLAPNSGVLVRPNTTTPARSQRPIIKSQAHTSALPSLMRTSYAVFSFNTTTHPQHPPTPPPPPHPHTPPPPPPPPPL